MSVLSTLYLFSQFVTLLRAENVGYNDRTNRLLIKECDEIKKVILIEIQYPFVSFPISFVWSRCLNTEILTFCFIMDFILSYFNKYNVIKIVFVLREYSSFYIYFYGLDQAFHFTWNN
jgi:hypothetical protein